MPFNPLCLQLPPPKRSFRKLHHVFGAQRYTVAYLNGAPVTMLIVDHAASPQAQLVKQVAVDNTIQLPRVDCGRSPHCLQIIDLSILLMNDRNTSNKDISCA